MSASLRSFVEGRFRCIYWILEALAEVKDFENHCATGSLQGAIIPIPPARSYG